VNDQHSATLLCLKRLAQLGHRRIGMATVSDTLKRTRHHFESPYLIFQNALPQSRRVPLFTIDGLDVKTNTEPWRERFLQWRAAHQPTAIICTFSQAIGWLRDSGMRVPEDVSIATLSCMQQPGWAGIDQQERTIGARAIELLISIFQAGERGVPDTALRMLVEGKWQEGPTVAMVGDPAQEVLAAIE
jgi:LacI family transcriptional regulator